MTLSPKEKAKELVDKFQLQMPIIVIPKLSTQINQYSCDIDLKRSITNAKQCALMTVYEIINELVYDRQYEYWHQVKTEIENL